MDDFFSWLWRGVSYIFQWSVIQGFLYIIGAGFLWIVTLGKYPTKKTSVDYLDAIAALGFFVIIAILNISYWIFNATK